MLRVNDGLTLSFKVSSGELMSLKRFNVFKPQKDTAGPTVIASSGAGLGAFGGVFTPSILTILGVIMYLRFGWVVGNAGLWGTFTIVSLSTLITFLTALSISQIATDQRVRAGGAYYMISRSLGIEAGGAVGIPLFFAQALSVALYTIGFAESLAAVLPYFNERIIAFVTTILVTALALISAKTAIKAQYFIMAAIVLSLLSLVFGKPLDAPLVAAVSEPKASFWVVFAVFFPAVTGIMAGVNMSGDLKNPRKAIPMGTLSAVGLSYLIYMLIPILLVQRADTASLLTDPLIMRRISFWGNAILLGVWGATLSSALGSILGAPRILQALARDGVLPGFLKIFGRGHGEADEPRLGTYLSLGIALAAVLLGDLNAIAPILSMFFLTTYGVVNIVSAVETFLGSPSFRPTFKVHWLFSLLGAIGCIAVMFLINWLATLVAISTILVIYIWLERRELETTWGDVRQGVIMASTRWGLLRLRAETDAKNWRPHFLVLSGSPTKRWYLIDLANTISRNKALLTIATVLPPDSLTTERQASLSKTVRDYLEEHGVQALFKVVQSQDRYTGSENLVAFYGLGSLVPNTVLLGTSESPEKRERYCEMLSNIYYAKRNLVIVNNKDENDKNAFGNKQRIDIWWSGLKGNGSLMMTLAYLLQSSLSWQHVELNIKMIIPEESGAHEAEANLSSLIGTTRIQANTQVLVKQGDPFELIENASQNADLVFLGIPNPEKVSNFQEAYTKLMQKTSKLPTTAYVLAAEELEFRDLLN